MPPDIVTAMSRLEGERVIVIGPTPPPIHGISVFTAVLLSRLEQAGRLAAHLDTTDERPLDNLGRLDLTNLWLGIKHALELARLLAADRDAAVYLALAPSRWGFLRDAVLIAIGRLWRRRVYVHLQGGRGLEELYATAGPVMRRVIRATTSSVHQAWALTPSLAAANAWLFPPGRVEVLGNVVEDPVAEPQDASTGSGPERGDGEFRILYLSNLLPEKGCLDLLEAVERMGPKASRWHVRFVGATPTDSVHSSMIEGAARLRDTVQIELRGVASGEAKSRELRWADVFVLPSRYPYEGQPHAILEALAARLPVVSTWHAGIPDTVRDGEEGLLVSPGDAAGLGEVLATLAADSTLRTEMGQRGRRRYESQFTPTRLDRDLARLLGAPSRSRGSHAVTRALSEPRTLLKEAGRHAGVNRLRWLHKARIVRSHGRRVSAELPYVLFDSETDNFTYEIANPAELGEWLDELFGAGEYLSELDEDAELESELRARLRWRPSAKSRALFGRRAGWYAIVRAIRPRRVVETGTHNGLGSTALLAALDRNQSGDLVSIDPRPGAGWMVPARLRGRWRPVRATSHAALESAGPIDLFIHDSLHTPECEGWELETAARLGASVLISDNAHSADTCRVFATEQGGTFAIWRERVKDHWYPGAAIGVALLGGRLPSPVADERDIGPVNG